MERRRWMLVAVIVLDLAMITVYLENMSVRLGYAAAQEEKRLQRLALESRTLRKEVAEARRPDQVGTRSAAFGGGVRRAAHDDIERPGRTERTERMARAGRR